MLTAPIALFSLSAQRKQAFHMRKHRIMSVRKSTSVAKMRSGHSAFLPAELLDGNLSEVRAHFRYLYPGLVEEMALKLTKERAYMKSICKVPMSYGGRQYVLSAPSFSLILIPSIQPPGSGSLYSSIVDILIPQGTCFPFCQLANEM